MMNNAIDNLSNPPIVGQYYKILCGYCNDQAPWFRGCYVPLIGPVHRDKEFIGFDHDHYHIDWRFVPPYLIKSLGRQVENGEWAGLVIKTVHIDRLRYNRRQCYREMPVFPTHTQDVRGVMNEVPWLRTMEAHFRQHGLSADGRCPHQGIDLSSIPEQNGIKVCPGHGLAWKDGKLHYRVNLSLELASCQQRRSPSR